MELSGAGLSLYFRLLVVFLCTFLLHWSPYLVCEAAPCYDYFTDKAMPCFPQPVNAATRRNVTATNTCGSPKSTYCEIGPGSQCFVCDANSSASMHPARFMVDQDNPFAESPTWWQSDTWWDTNQRESSQMGEPLKVNITLAFGKSYHISGKIRVTFYTERPHALIIERSADNASSWQVYQYFAKDCLEMYGMTPSEAIAAEDPLAATCSEEYSGQFPAKNGIVEFQAYSRYSPEDYMLAEIQDYMRATHVRLRLEYPGTDGLELINSEVTLNRYYYAISDIRVDGRCDCHGHAEFCDGAGMNQYCYCEHYTTGRDCEQCLPMYNKEPWKAANKTHANECQKCDCHDHANTCSYDANLKAGVCHYCNHNTTGDYCEKCSDGYYRDVDKNLRDLDVCLPCDCFPVGIVDEGSCNQEMSVDLGQCHCKANVFGRRCDECVPGYWGFRIAPGGSCQDCQCNVLGAINGSKDCDQQTGECFCKSSIQGEKCDECRDGYYSFPSAPDSSCAICPCDVGGAYKTCDKPSGQCFCRPNIEGDHCDTVKPGYFVPFFDFLLFEAEFQPGAYEIQLEHVTSNATFTGQGYAKLSSQSLVDFRDIQVGVSQEYYVMLRYEATDFPQNGTLEVTVGQTSYDVNVSLSDLDVGSGLTWTPNKLLYLEKDTTYDVRIEVHSNEMLQDFRLDSLVLKPAIFSTRIYEESDAETVNKLLDCYEDFGSLDDRSPQCTALAFSHGTEMYDGALPCDCNGSGTSQVDSCDPDGGQCSCYTGVGGRKCDYCLPTYHGFGQGPCTVCQCNSAGIKSDICDITSGACQCKESTTGEECHQCKPGSFNLDAGNPQGCQACFGYGHGRVCEPAQDFIRSHIVTRFTDGELDGWNFENDSSSVFSQDGLSIDGGMTLLAPAKYLGEQLKSYHQRIILKVVPASRDNVSVHVKLQGHGYQAMLTPNVNTSHDIVEVSFTLAPSHDVVSDPPPLTEFEFQSMLSNLSSLRLLLSSSLDLKQVVMETAIYEPAASDPRVSFVENVTCFDNYTGLSCQHCASGFTRAPPNAGPFSKCVPCSCNGRSNTCDSESGVCLNCDIGSTGDHCERCQYHVVGPHCNICADSFYGLTEHDKMCKPCDCHLPGTLHGNTSSCNVTTGQCHCNKTLNTGGRRCNVCQENAWNRSDSNTCEECPSCFGMIKREVDKFRLDFSAHVDSLYSLQSFSVFSEFKPFITHVEQTRQAIEGLGQTAQTLALQEQLASLEREAAFQILDIFAGHRDTLTTQVAATLNGTAAVIEGYSHSRATVEQISSLVTSTHHLLGNVVSNLTSYLLVPIDLLHRWTTALNDTKLSSEAKVESLTKAWDIIRSSVQDAGQFATQAAVNASSVVSALQKVSAKISLLQDMRDTQKEIGKSLLDGARQRYENASVLFNSSLDLDILELFSSLSERMVSLNQSSMEITNNAMDVVKTVHHQVQSNVLIVQDINQALATLHSQQLHVDSYQSKTTSYLSQSLGYEREGNAAIMEVERLYSETQNLLTIMRDFPSVVVEWKTRSVEAFESISELTSSHRSAILFAINISILVEPSHDGSKELIQMAKTAKDYAEKETDDLYKVFVLSLTLRNITVARLHGTTDRHSSVMNYVDTTVTPVVDQCAVITPKSREMLVTSSNLLMDSRELLEKVKNTSRELRQVMVNVEALPSIDTRPLLNIKADITRIRAAFDDLKLTSSLNKLRQGKEVQQQWLSINQPRVATLRAQISFVRSIIASLRAKTC